MKVHHESTVGTVSHVPSFSREVDRGELSVESVEKKEEIQDDSIPKKSALDFFKNIIQENENETKKREAQHEARQAASEISFTPHGPVESSPFQEFQSYKASSEHFTSERQVKEEVFLEPGPPPEIGFVPKSSAPILKEEKMADRVKKLEESTRRLSETEAPLGGVKIFPTPLPKKDVQETRIFKESSEYSSKQVHKAPVLRPPANVEVRPESPRPSAEGISMEKLWASKFNHEPPPERPKSPLPSAEGLAMDKLWGHKYSDSTVARTVWPPPEPEFFARAETTKQVEKSEFSHKSEVKECFSKTQECTRQEKFHQEFAPRNIVTPEIKPTDKIIYVAEAHTIKSTSNAVDTQQSVAQFSSSSDFSRTETNVVEENILKPSEAKKIWPQGLPVEIEKKPKPRPEPQRVQPVQQLRLDDVGLEPGPPPEIGFATPAPKTERRQSYVETIEQGLEKDLEKEPSRHLVGAVRTIPPPPKKEKSVERQDFEFKRSFSASESSSFKKFSTVPRPSKFVKKSFADSDYESEVERTKIKARWTPWDSDTEEFLTFRRVKPPTVQQHPQQPRRPHSVEPPPVVAPIYYTSRTTNKKKVSPPQQKQTTDSGYMADTDEPRRFVGAQMKVEKKSVASVSKSFEKKETSSTKVLEPFPFKPDPPSVAPPPTKQRAIIVPSPSKFVKGEFKESDYESDYEGKIKPVWRPKYESGEEPSFRPVKPVESPCGRVGQPIRPLPLLQPGSPPKMDFAPPSPGFGKAVETSNTLNFSESTQQSRRVVSVQQTTRVMSFDQSAKRTERQTSLPSKFVPKGDAKWMSAATDSELRRVDEMRKRFSGGEKQLELVPGEPPQFDYAPPCVPAPAAVVANKHISEMTSTFKSKAQQFATNILKDVKENGRDIAMKEEKKDDPQAYREESRVAEYGECCFSLTIH
ncbi:hypothetical protein AAG570_004425 [Ranatra chinensis]|uniref:Uncharacterized protein n=1 Tax=Ranatra chinensis TaxID=642074 RepID=A0ABD0Y0T7_9HEMI